MIDPRNSLVGGEMPKTAIFVGPPRVDTRTDLQGRTRKSCFRDGVIFRPETNGKWVQESGTIHRKNELLDGINEANVHVTALYVLTQEEKEEAVSRLMEKGFTAIGSGVCD